ncbi:phospholipid carrier-dependent glycosyltransferase [Actinomadura rubrisoli]|uniref:Phospholipid carrier-dependent glycosyltransferase n=1 Tax=Actinomadura rubrisoli TaxID=2530368 RepID=A0A4R5BZD2_9ACTN|nr:phospholipid carrier-dependent glycosyltransferase [Actinomadura rubrisoli]TDD92611.1 phospholipid carrier-dependent glycosyltransferase [Actinomadura rubrisoli]
MPSRLLAALKAIRAYHPHLRHAPFLLALAGGALLRWTAMRAYPKGLWFTGDSYFYVAYALHPQPSPSKTLGYPFLLRLMEPLHSLTAVVAVQHLMGLAVAVMAYAVLCRAGLPGWGAAIVTLPLLYDAYQVELEHLLMSEALFTFLIAAALTLLLWRVKAAPGKDAGPTWWMALAAGLLLGYAVLVRSAGAPLVPVVLLCLLMRRQGWRPALAFGAAAAVPLVAYAMWFHAERGTYALTTSDGIYLWGRTAGFADCSKIDLPSNEQALCLDAATKAEHDPPGHLIWRAEVPPRVIYGSVVTPKANAALRDFSIRAILAQPGAYLRTVGHGVGMAFAWDRSPHPTAATEGLYHFPDRPQVFPGGRSWGGGGTALSDAMRYGRTDTPSEVVQPHAGRMIDYQDRWFVPGPALGALFALGAAGVAVARRRRREVLMAWGTGVTLLLFPIASADFDYRYVVPAMPFACLAVGLALSALRARASEDETGRADAEGEPDGTGEAGGDGGTGGEGEERDDAGAGGGKGVSRWWGTRGSRHRDSDPATVP